MMASDWVKMPAARYPIGVGYNGRRTRCPGWGAMTDLRRFARAQVHSCNAARSRNCMNRRRGAPKPTRQTPCARTTSHRALKAWKTSRLYQVILVIGVRLRWWLCIVTNCGSCSSFIEQLLLLATTVAPWSVRRFSQRGRQQ